MTSNYIVDTNILILYFSGKLNEALPSSDLGVSIISEIELLSFTRLSAKEERQLRAILGSMERFSLSDDIKEQTIRMRKQHKIKLPDAIICATAMISQATLLTNDKQLLNLPGLEVQSLVVKK